MATATAICLDLSRFTWAMGEMLYEWIILMKWVNSEKYFNEQCFETLLEKVFKDWRLLNMQLRPDFDLMIQL